MRSLSASVAFFAAVLVAALPLAAASASASSLQTAHHAALPMAEPEPITWSVKPADDQAGGRFSFDYTTDPGTQITDKVIIVNSGTVAADFRVYATDAINDFATGDLSLLPANTAPTDVGSWITLDVKELHLEPGTQATVPFNLLVPSDASPGDHSAGIVASVITTGDQNGQAVVIDQRVGARVNLRLSGATTVALKPSGLVAGYAPSLNPFAPGTMQVDYSVKNTGNIRLDISQSVDIVGPFGIHLGSLTPDPIKNLLPGQAAHIVAKVTGVGALALAWSSIELVPGPVGGAPAPAAAPATDPAAPAAFDPASATTVSLAVSWTFLGVIVLLALIVFLVSRYVRNTREQFYAAIEQAEIDARERAAGDVPAGSTDAASSPTTTVAATSAEAR